MWKYLKYSLPAVLAIVLSFILQFTVISQPERFAGWLANFGPYVILAYIVVQSITLLIPPLGGSFILIGMLAILGPEKGLLLSYLVTTPVYFLNFLLARKFGRPIVEKVAGKIGLTRIDHYIADAGVGTLWVLKIFENSYFDFISYAIGLTKISYRDFIIINFIGGIPSTLIYYFILIKSPNFLTSMILIQVAAGVLIVASILIKHLKKSLSQSPNDKVRPCHSVTSFATCRPELNKIICFYDKKRLRYETGFRRNSGS